MEKDTLGSLHLSRRARLEVSLESNAALIPSLLLSVRERETAERVSGERGNLSGQRGPDSSDALTWLSGKYT